MQFATKLHCFFTATGYAWVEQCFIAYLVFSSCLSLSHFLFLGLPCMISLFYFCSPNSYPFFYIHISIPIFSKILIFSYLSFAACLFKSFVNYLSSILILICRLPPPAFSACTQHLLHFPLTQFQRVDLSRFPSHCISLRLFSLPLPPSVSSSLSVAVFHCLRPFSDSSFILARNTQNNHKFTEKLKHNNGRPPGGATRAATWRRRLR